MHAGEHAGHAHHGHLPLERAPGQERRLAGALAILLALMGVELGAGIAGRSLALVSDAGHMLADAGALGFSLLALRLAARPAKGAMTFGLARVEILSAQANGVTLLVLAGFVVYGAARRLASPPRVDGWLMLGVALGGILANLAAVWLLRSPGRRSLNIEGSFQHVLTDLYAFLGTAGAAVVILAGGWERADAVASLLIAGLMVRAGGSMVRASGRVFLEAAPEGLEPAEIGTALASQPGVVEVHDLHVWEVTSGFPALSAHVLVRAEDDCHEARRELEELLRERFHIDHTTLQVDHTGERLLEIQPRARGGSGG